MLPLAILAARDCALAGARRAPEFALHVCRAAHCAACGASTRSGPMRRTGRAGLGLAAAAVATAAVLAAHPSAAQTPPDSAAGKFTLSSPDISPGGQNSQGPVVHRVGCHGGHGLP